MRISDWSSDVCSSDLFLDGYIARHFNQTSELGKVLDPVADRLLFFVGVGANIVDDSVPHWFAVGVLVREALVAGAPLALAELAARRIDVTCFAKAGPLRSDERSVGKTGGSM